MGFFDSESKAIQFNRPGDVGGGVITGAYTTRQQTVFGSNQLKFNDNGTPANMAVVPVMTSERDPLNPQDDGARTLYVDKVAMKLAIQAALKAASATDLEVGGTIYVQYTHDAPSGKGNPQKEFAAQYTRPVGGLGIQNGNGAPTQQAPAQFPVQQPQLPVQQQQPVAPQFPVQPAAPAFPPQQPQPALFGQQPPAQVPAQAPSPDANPQIAAIRAMAGSGMTAVQIANAFPAFTADAIQAVMSIPA